MMIGMAVFWGALIFGRIWLARHAGQRYPPRSRRSGSSTAAWPRVRSSVDEYRRFVLIDIRPSGF